MDSGRAASSTPQFRNDLEGLRGIAIALVVVFHIFVGRVSGGVDVFLFLSGYFFVGSQVRYALRENPRVNPWWPMWRTARRLIPSLVVVLAATVILVFALVPGLVSGELLRQFTATIFFAQNRELAAQGSDYAAVSPEASPLQHLWSISIQGQFYLAAILLGTVIAVLVTRTGISRTWVRRGTIALLVVVTVASLSWASRFGLFGTEPNYYSFFSRAWELTLGGLLALAAQVQIPRRFSALTAGSGLTLIALTGVVIPTTLAYPGPLTLMPIGGAALIVLSNPANPVSSILSSRPITWLGSVAYPLYLWHWPLLIIAVTIGSHTIPPLSVGLGVIALSIVLAQATHTAVEEPLRMHGKRPTKQDAPVTAALGSLRRPAGAARAAGGVLIATSTAAILSLSPMWERHVTIADSPSSAEQHPGAMALRGASVPDVPAQPAPMLASSITTHIFRDGCVISQDEPGDAAPEADCVYGDPEAETTVALVGGSHAETYGVALDELGKKHGFKVITFIRQTCPMVFTPGDLVSHRCAKWSLNTFNELASLDPAVVVSTSTRPAGSAGEASPSTDSVPPEYVEVWDAFAEAEIPFLGLRDNPWIFDADGTPLNPNGCVVNGGSVAECSMPATTMYSPEDPAADYSDADAMRHMVDTSGWYCPDGLCPPVIGNVTVYRDQNHISNAYSLTLAPLIWHHLGPLWEETAGS